MKYAIHTERGVQYIQYKLRLEQIVDMPRSEELKLRYLQESDLYIAFNKNLYTPKAILKRDKNFYNKYRLLFD